MFRFTIRDVLWLTVVAALALGWWLDHRKARKIEAEYIRLSQRTTSLVEQLDARGISTFTDPEGPGVVISERQVFDQNDLVPRGPPTPSIPIRP